MMLLHKDGGGVGAGSSFFFRGGAACFIAALLLAGARCQGQDTAAAVLPPSKWVAPLSFAMPSASEPVDPSQDYRWLLSDRQINAQTDEEFVHDARQTLTSAGVQYGSHIMIHYDPACQTVTFHWARLWRGTNILNRLDPSQVSLGQAELDPENFPFGSEKTAILLLDDVRVGDIVDYAYTITGGNPALAGKFAGKVRLQFAQPVNRIVTRLLWPASRRLYMKNHLATLPPATVRKGNLLQLTWDLRAVPALRLEPPTPIWYDPYPSVQLSEFRTWAEVNRWALPIFTVTNAPSPELARKINEWRSWPAPADRVLAALRFVQEDIRFQGAEGGLSSYDPAKPSVVFARRYGDGKEKALLLTAILRALKIEAFPALVNTRLRHQVAELQPSATVFDHVIVQVNLDGQSSWLDPTANYERGFLTERSWPNYGWGLRVAPGVVALTPIPPCSAQPLTTVTESLNIGDLNRESFATITTVAVGSDANRLRQLYATTPREEIERENLDAYAQLYPRIRRTAPRLYSDDETQNRIEITDFFAIQGIWSRVTNDVYFRCRIYSPNVDDALIKPDVPARTMPLGVSYPVHQVFHADVTMPVSVPLDLSSVTIQNPAFFFQRTASLPGGKLTLGYEYRSWSDAVEPEAMPAYVRDVNAATGALGFTVAGFMN